jgi:trehalose-6-phosphate synthase
VYGTCNALHRALTMSPEEKHTRARALRALVKKADIRTWFQDQVDDAMRAFESQSRKDSTPVTS